MKHNNISILTLCLSAFSLTLAAQNVTVLKQGGVGHVYEIEQVDSVVYFPIGDAEQFPASEAESTTTLWDIIKAQPNLKKFAAILEAANYYTGKGKAPSGLHFSQLLSGSVPLSVYAPTDAAISADRYSELLALAKTDGWKLQQEFLFNHISPQERNEAGNDAVQMLNSKIVGLASYNVTAIDQECNNGKLFTMPSVFPYLPNLEEYLLSLAPDCTLAREFIANYAAAETVFDAGNSISIPSKDGNIMVLDSVFASHSQLMEQYLVSNDLMQIKGFGADLANENASYSMIMPTDAVWADGQAKLGLKYNYANRYEDKLQGDKDGRTYVIDAPNPDSLSASAVGAGILVPLLGKTASGQEVKLSNGTAYTASEWPVPASVYSPDVEVELTGNEFYATSISSYYKAGSGIALWDMTQFPMEHITSKYGAVSNGSFYFLRPTGPTTNPRVEIKLVGEQGEQVMSGKYDVQVVMVPYWYTLISMPKNLKEATTVRYTYNDMGEVVKADTITYYSDLHNPDYGDPINSKEEDDSTFIADVTKYAELLKDEYYVDSISAVTKMSFMVQIRYNNNSTNGKDVTNQRSPVMEYDGIKVDSLLVFEDFEFPYSYRNISNSYPTLILEGATKSATAKKGFMYGLCVDKIILRSKEDGSETVVTP